MIRAVTWKVNKTFLTRLLPRCQNQAGRQWLPAFLVVCSGCLVLFLATNH